MQFLQVVLLLLACQKCSVYTKILCVGEGDVSASLLQEKTPTWSSAVKEIYTRTIQNHRHWSTLPETYGIALGTIKGKKKSYMKFTLLRAKDLIEKTDYAPLQHMHELSSSPAETDNF